MPTSDAFTLSRSDLNPFLFAEVGTELNGSPLTILSVLARLGEDPWTAAAKLAKLPKKAMIDRLTDLIAQMPLAPQAIAEAGGTAARLIQLLPSPLKPVLPVAASKVKLLQGMPAWMPLAIFLGALAFGIAFNMIPGKTNPAPTPITQSFDHAP